MPIIQKKILVIGHIWPEPLATAAGVRMLQLVEGFKELGYEIIFASAALKTEHSNDFGKMDVEEIAIKLNDSDFDKLLVEHKPDVVMFDRFMTEEQYGWRVAEQLPGCLRILNTEDLHSLRAVREQDHKENRMFSTAQWLQSDMAKREMASIYRSDLNLIISRFEIDFLVEKAFIPSHLLMYLPFLHNKIGSGQNTGLPGFDERVDFVFIGNGKHSPNRDAIHWLNTELWPLIKKELPKSTLHVYGAYLPETLQNLHQPEIGFEVHGWTEDINQVLKKARINLVPLRYGAGLKGKIFQAMTCGTPNIATEVGLEGLDSVAPDNDSELSDAQRFAIRAVQLYKDKSGWLEQQRSDQELLRAQFNRDSFLEQLKDQLDHKTEHLQEHRLKNPVGSMLLHHTMASTRHLSKWIELKNQTYRAPEMKK
ncbi:MAG: glycosyltransferase [Flavobacteriaceae bacterium]